jgi:hypothetical protein
MYGSTDGRDRNSAEQEESLTEINSPLAPLGVCVTSPRTVGSQGVDAKLWSAAACCRF